MKKSPVNLMLNIHIACEHESVPSNDDIKTWVLAALNGRSQSAEIGIRIIDEKEMSELNHNYRHKQGPTNILSFAYGQSPLSGDMAICASIVNQEATSLGIEKKAHWAHILVHGVLHLLGFDHEKDDEAELMENLETAILAKLGVSNPYE